MSKYIRKTCPMCHKPAHDNQTEGAKCLFNHHSKESRDHALKCVHLIYGVEMKELMDKLPI
jgi:hypothetical protein